MSRAVRILIVEDRPDDVELLLDELRRSDFAPEWDSVQSEPAFVQRLQQEWDVILADYKVPGLEAPRVLQLVKEHSLDVPVIVLSGVVGEETVWECLKHGATDYLMKDRLTRLGSAVTQAIEKRDAERALQLSRQKAEENRRRLEARQQYAQKLESLGILAGGVAHEFNNLLTVIIGNVSLALAELHPDSSLYENLRQVEIAANRAAELTSQMLSFSGKGILQTTSFNLSELVEDSIDLLKSFVVSDKVAIHTELAGGLPEMQADPEQIRQILINLCANASEACMEAKGGGEIAIRTAIVARNQIPSTALSPDELFEEEYFLLEIKDNGLGMAPEMLPKVFDPFFTTKFPGRGLGLAAVLGIVRSHRGAVHIDSQRNVGTTVDVFIPVRQRESRR
ncbi:MAG: hypothetical protein KatS3mg105_4142 [Gemmatales bacterium]|nr:MAG: hypothetical protein KatS3mg105_4142 [Gemmatales bacterium]